MRHAIRYSLLCCAVAVAQAPADVSGPLLPQVAPQLLGVQRIYVDRLTGNETAEQMRDLLIASLHATRLFILTENPERADATLRGAAEDLVYTDQFQSSEGVDLRTSASAGSRSTRPGVTNRSFSVGVGDNESVNIHERKHEALATVRLINKDGDVIWSTTQESSGGKFRGASADVAEKIARQLADDIARLRTAR